MHPLPAGGAEAAAAEQQQQQQPANTKAKYYVVVSVGRQTFASKRVRRVPAASSKALPAGGAVVGSGASGASGASASASSSAAAAANGGDSRARFLWEEGTDVVLQRGGATVAQLALYKAGAVDGALGDKLQASASPFWAVSVACAASLGGVAGRELAGSGRALLGCGERRPRAAARRQAQPAAEPPHLPPTPCTPRPRAVLVHPGPGHLLW